MLLDFAEFFFAEKKQKGLINWRKPDLKIPCELFFFNAVQPFNSP